ncbi:MAG TPA: allantoinase AllB [Chitinophagaceae bacterium]|nr:allantoinase AllB [Chitinophagaceae bacterium]
MNIDAAIKTDRLISAGGLRSGFVLIKQGIIIDVVTELPAGDFPVTDLGSLVLMPGIVDPHVHINEPGRTAWEGFDTATRAALAGGITTLVEMPLNASPVTTTVNAFEKKLESIGLTGKLRPGTAGPGGKLHVNCGFWGGVIPGNENEIEPLINQGVLGFKAFLTHSGIDEFPNVTEEDLRKAQPIIASHGLPLLVHCELSEQAANDVTNNRSYTEYVLSRPKKWEDDAIALIIRLCEEFNCRTHIVHLSSADSIEQIRRAKEKGLPLTVETAQHYLYFNEEMIGEGQTVFKCAPPIRDKQNNQLLWQALKEGIIDFVASDHSPAPPELKEIGSGNFRNAWGGISSLQFALPTLWTAARNQGCQLEDMAKWLSENPSRLPGLENNKGRIEKGYDADFVVWDPEKEFTVAEEMILHRHKITPYLHENLYGVVEQTWLAGKKVFDKGKFLHLNKGQVIFGKRRIIT